MPLLIDTYNVLHTVGILPPDIAGVDAPGLIELIRVSRYRQEHATLICDGVPQDETVAGRVGNITVRYSGHESTADEVIITKIRKSFIPRRLTVVSSDRAILREARRRRCKPLTSEEFLSQLAADYEAVAARRAGGRAAAEGDASGQAGRVSKRKKRPREAVLPAELLREAEALVREGLPDEPEPRAAEPQDAGEPQASSSGDSGERSRPEESPVDPVRSVLPEQLIEEAEAIVDAQSRPVAPQEAHGPRKSGPRKSRPRQGGALNGGAENPPPAGQSGGEDLVDLRPDDAIPPDIMDEAESLWREGADEEPPPGAGPSAPAGG